MRTMLVLLLVVASSAPAFGSPGGVLENVRKIQIEPTVIAQPENVKDPAAANLARYNLRAAIRDALMEEGDSPIRAHVVLDGFYPEGATKRIMDFGSGRSPRIVDARLVIQDASGKELANVKIHLRGSVALDPNERTSTQGHSAGSDFEQRWLEEIERLR